MRFTVTKKIITSLTIIFVIGTVAMILIYAGLYKVKMAMLELAEEKEPLMAATNEMEINMNGIAMLVLRYMNTINPRYRQRVEKTNETSSNFTISSFNWLETRG